MHPGVFRQPLRGRFAPTPSGPLHFGSLVAAFASVLDIRSRGGEWLLRIDDLDRAREAPGARAAILADLAVHGFRWDGGVRRQTHRNERYARALEELLGDGRAFPCGCSRGEIAARSEDGLYPGTCRHGLPEGKPARCVRLRAPDEVLRCNDRLAGRVTQNLAREVGDFVVWRAEGIASYHLATVLDDADEGITHVMRGADLLASTPRQVYLQRLLGLPTPRYAHIPLVRENGLKLGKQTHARRLDSQRPAATLAAALEFLQQAPPRALRTAATDEVWRWALAHWNPAALRGAC